MSEPTKGDSVTSTETETPTTPQDAESAPESAEQPSPAAEGQPDAPEAPEQPAARPMQPSEVAEAPEDDRDALGDKTVVVHSPAGALTLRPTQRDLDPAQVEALISIGIDTRTDPLVIPQVRPFMHMCQIRGLDPFAREAYLIGRGRGNNRKFTMQTGIDGYRKMGAATGRFVRVKKRLWSGGDDNPESWVQVTDEDGDVVRKRVWWEQWPTNLGNPGAAKVVIEHYDTDGATLTTTAAVADWGMYAPYSDVYEGPQGNRKKKIGPDGKPVQELNEMWTKGGPHMLAKCAEALAYRMAFPAKMSGIYVSEEMHRADQQERDRQADARALARRKAYEDAQREQRTATPTMPDEPVEADVVEPAAEATAEAPRPASDAAEHVESLRPEGDDAGDADTPIDPWASPAADDAVKVEWLHAEFAYQAESLGTSTDALARRVVAAKRKNLDDFGLDDLLPMVAGFRAMVVNALSGNEDETARAYVAAATDNGQPIDFDAIVSGS